MTVLDGIARAILLNLASERLRPLLQRLADVAETGASEMERAVARDLIKAIRGWDD